jgi:hypothetical protein
MRILCFGSLRVKLLLWCYLCQQHCNLSNITNLRAVSLAGQCNGPSPRLVDLGLVRTKKKQQKHESTYQYGCQGNKRSIITRSRLFDRPASPSHPMQILAAVTARCADISEAFTASTLRVENMKHKQSARSMHTVCCLLSDTHDDSTFLHKLYGLLSLKMEPG